MLGATGDRHGLPRPQATEEHFEGKAQSKSCRVSFLKTRGPCSLRSSDLWQPQQEVPKSKSIGTECQPVPTVTLTAGPASGMD